MRKFWTKPRIVFFIWAVIELSGWLLTYFWPDPRVNWVWLGLTIAGIIPMALFMPMKSPKMRRIMLLWVLVLAAGMGTSFLAFLWEPLMFLISYLGPFWLILMGAAFLLNALWWPPRLLIAGGILQITAGLLSWTVPVLLVYQYLVAAAAGTGAMLVLMYKKT